jgi:BioD-like phosphotransacetylase family protein
VSHISQPTFKVEKQTHHFWSILIRITTYQLVDIKNVDAHFLNSEERLAEAMVKLIDQSKLTLLSYHCHSLVPVGVSCAGILLESHIALQWVILNLSRGLIEKLEYLKLPTFWFRPLWYS